MSDRWETYAEAADRLNMTTDAVRHRARRLGWRRTRSNDGKTLVMVPDDVEPIELSEDPVIITRSDDGSSPERSHDDLAIDLLHDRIRDLQADLSRERNERLAEREATGRMADRLIEAEKAKSDAEKAAALAQAEVAHLQERLTAEMTAHRSEIDHRDDRLAEIASDLKQMRSRSLWQRLVG
ncbi:hypothetical protein [Fulvimarina manganoxydans]|uniref:hypothetical protein n=1 Tax=Fulvimarina manganoxydans TaxID=937218 RepID=UPI00111BFABA|nr:hypothetical protein [Fulvimarina manganoxydans]